jgi:flagellar hook-associated protein 3 FlgL
MSIDRVATNAQSQFMLNQINRANVSLSESQQQVSSGKLASDYAGYKDKVSILEAARSAGARVDAYKAATEQAITQTDLQDTQITSLANLASQLREALTKAVGQNDGGTVMTEAQSIFDSASQILNSKDANGNFIYAGENNNTQPFTATSLANLASMPNASAAFVNGTLKQSVRVGDGQTTQIGQLASEMGTDLMNTLKSVADYVNANGGFTDTLTPAQSGFLGTQIGAAKAASDHLNNVAAANGFTYNQLKDASVHQDSMSSLYKGFVSDIEDVDMPTAVARLNQNQVALQAALQVTSQLQQISLLNYLGKSG